MRIRSETPRRSWAELWPWPPATAIVLAPVILVVLVTGLAVLRRFVGWPSDAYQGWALLAVAVLAMLPVLFVLVQLLAGTGGEFKYRNLSLSFVAASQEAASAIRTTTLEENLSTDPGDPLERTSLNCVLRGVAPSP